MQDRAAHVVSPRSSIARSGSALQIRTVDEAGIEHSQSVPVRALRSLTVSGASSVSVPALELCMRHGVQVHILNFFGRYVGTFSSSHSGTARIRGVQYRRAEDSQFGLELAKRFVAGKIAGQQQLVRRWTRSCISNPAAQLGAADEALLRATPLAAPGLPELRGIEGSATRAYFGALGSRVQSAQNHHFRFLGRNRRPPRDRFNCLLSYLYMLLLSDVSAALSRVGLDPAVGFLHAGAGDHRPALALDLIEEFRPWIADRLALRLVNRREVDPHADFIVDAAAVLLSRSGMRKVSAAYMKQLERRVSAAGERAAIMVSGVLLRQADVLKGAIVDGVPDRYAPFLLR